MIAQSGSEPVALLPDLPNPSVLRQVRAGQSQRLIESIPDRGLYLRAIVPVNVSTIADEGRILQVLQRVPSSIAKDADLVNTGITNYGVLQDSRLGLKRIFGPHAYWEGAKMLLKSSAVALIVYLGIRAMMPLLGRSLDSRRIVVDVTGVYWHFMAGLWIYIFALMHFMK